MRLDAVDGQLLDLNDPGLSRFVSEASLEKARLAKEMGAYTIVHEEGRLVRFSNHLTEGAVACAMSHHAALEAVAFHPTADWGLILEDDITMIVPRVHEVIERLLRRLPADWDALYLGYHGGCFRGMEDHDEAEESRARLELQVEEMLGPNAAFKGSLDPVAGPTGEYETPMLRMFGQLFGLYSWVVRKEAARAMLEGAFPVDGQVDAGLARWLVDQRLRAFKVAPRHLICFSPKSEAALDSDIQTMARLDEVLTDPERCQRYIEFLQQEQALGGLEE